MSAGSRERYFPRACSRGLCVLNFTSTVSILLRWRGRSREYVVTRAGVISPDKKCGWLSESAFGMTICDRGRAERRPVGRRPSRLAGC